MRISILPKSAYGWCSVGLAIGTLVFMGLVEEILYPDYTTTLAVILTFVLAAIGGAASATGLISMIKRREGAILVFISTAIGLVFLITEFADAVQTIMGLP